MRTSIFVLSCLITNYSFSQHELTSKQIDRLADAGKVYGYIKYFHPPLQYKNHQLDSAFAVNVGGILQAKTKREYATALQAILSVMDDGLTRIVNVTESAGNYRALPLEYYVKDSILYVQMNDAPFLTTDSKLREALGKLNITKGAIIDMRKPKHSQYNAMLGNGKYLDWNTSWFKGAISSPSMRAVSYSGFPNEACPGCGNLFFREDASGTSFGYAKKEVPMVFVVRSEDEIPLVSISLQRTGKVKILQEQGKELLPGSSLHFYISDSVLVQIRTAESIDTDGSLLLLHPDATFTHEDSFDAVMMKAKRLLANDKGTLRKQERIHPLQANRSFHFPGSSAFPSLGYRMLAAAKMFTVVEHFYPSRSTMIRDWEAAYKAAIPDFIRARDSIEYWRAIATLHSNIRDNHGFISKSQEGFSLRLHPIIQGRGSFAPPVFTRMVQNKIVVSGVFDDSICKELGVEKGDIVLSVDGNDPMDMLDEVRRYQNAGNTRAQNFYLASFILFGGEGQVKKLKIQKPKGGTTEVLMPLVKEFKGDWMADRYVAGMFHHNRPALKMLTKDIAYAGLTANIDSIFQTLEKSKGFIFDLRGYPKGGDEFLNALRFYKKINKVAPYIYQEVTGDMPAPSPKLSSVTRWGSSLANDIFYKRYLTNDRKLNLPAKVVVLIDETQQSASETYTYAIKNICNATLIGTPTGGAYAYFVNYTIPGNVRLWLSGSVISREGIQPDIFVETTLKGQRAGKDEALDRAVRFLQTGLR